MNYSQITSDVAISLTFTILLLLVGFADTAEGQLPQGVTVLPNYQPLTGPVQPVRQFLPTQTPIVTMPNVALPNSTAIQPPVSPAPS